MSCSDVPIELSTVNFLGSSDLCRLLLLEVTVPASLALVLKNSVLFRFSFKPCCLFGEVARDQLWCDILGSHRQYRDMLRGWKFRTTVSKERNKEECERVLH